MVCVSVSFPKNYSNQNLSSDRNSNDSEIKWAKDSQKVPFVFTFDDAIWFIAIFGVAYVADVLFVARLPFVMDRPKQTCHLNYIGPNRKIRAD